jgi:hypothetical protein
VHNRVLSLFSDGIMVELLEGEEDEDDDAALDTCCIFVFLLLFLSASFELSLSFVVSGH